MEKGQQTVRDKPTQPTESERLLRVRLILEEALEFAEACGVKVAFRDQFSNDLVIATDKNYETKIQGEFDIVEYADALGDISYVSYGAANCAGIDMEPIEEEIHRSNIDKFRNGIVRDEHGKVVKPEGWTAPDIKSEIEKQLK